MNFWFIEYMLSGAFGAFFISLFIFAVGLFIRKYKKLSGRFLKLMATFSSFTLMLIGICLLLLSIIHTIIFVKLNGDLPPIYQFSISPPQEGSITRKPIVTFHLQQNKSFALELNPYAAPDTVNSFVNLVKEGFFNGMVFRRLEKGRLIQAADPKLRLMKDLLPSAGYNIYGEFEGNGYANPMKFDRGEIGLAKQFGYTIAPGVFFIMTSSYPEYAQMMPAFGKVISGMDLIDKISFGKTITVSGKNITLSPMLIEKVTVETFGFNYPQTTKLPDTALKIQYFLLDSADEINAKVAKYK